MVIDFEEHFAEKYKNNCCYAYVTLYHAGEYGRVRAFSDLTAKDVSDFFRAKYGCAVRLRVQEDKVRVLAPKQLLIQKVQFGLFVCSDV